MNMAVHFSSDRQDWATPMDFFGILDSEFNFTLDVCANDHNTKCERFFTEADDLPALRENVVDAVRCHFPTEEERPKLVRLHHVRDEILAL